MRETRGLTSMNRLGLRTSRPCSAWVFTPPECVYQCMFTSGRERCVHDESTHRYRPSAIRLLHSWIIHPRFLLVFLEDSRSYSTSQNRTTTAKWWRSAKSPNPCSLRPCLTGQSLSVLQTVEWSRVWSIISSRLLQRCLSINIMNIATGLLVRVAGSQCCCLW